MFRKPCCTVLKDVKKVWNQTVRMLHPCYIPKRLGILGVPFHHGQTKPGVLKSPDIIREAGLTKELNEMCKNKLLEFKDFGNLSYNEPDTTLKEPDNMKNYYHFVECNKALSNQVKEMLCDNRSCIVIGGDHAIGTGSIDGHLKYNPNTIIVWVDAHADINTSTTSESGNIHGMPLSFLAKDLIPYMADIPCMEWCSRILSLKNLVYIGLRSIDPMEKLIIEKFGAHAYTIRDVDKYGIVKIMEMALDRTDPRGACGYHLSFDIDAIDPIDAGSTGTPCIGGLTVREGMYIVEEMERTGRLQVMDMVEVNTELGTEFESKKTVQSALELLLVACGKMRSGTLPAVDDLPMPEK